MKPFSFSKPPHSYRRCSLNSSARALTVRPLPCHHWRDYRLRHAGGDQIGLATQVAFSIWRSHRHSPQLACYDDHCAAHPAEPDLLHNPHLLAPLAKIPEKSAVIVEHDNVGYLDPDVRRCWMICRERRSAVSASISGRLPAADRLPGRLVRPLIHPSLKRRLLPCSTLSSLLRQPQGNKHEHHKSYAAKEAGADLSLGIRCRRTGRKMSKSKWSTGGFVIRTCR